MMERQNDPYRHAYLKAKATTNGVMHALFNWYLIITLINLVIISLFLWLWNPIGKLNELLNQTTTTEQTLKSSSSQSSSNSSSTETSDETDFYEAPTE